MNITRFTKAKVIIIEGVPGAGKTTLQKRLRQGARGRSVSAFPEEALLFGWIHAWIPGIDAIRMSLMQRMIDHIEHSLAESPELLFVLNRFHISYFLFATAPDMAAYDSLIARLRGLDVLVLVPQIAPTAVAERAVHVERVDPLWQAHLNKRLENSGCRDIAAMYTEEQKKVRQLLKTQHLQYEILEAIEPEQGRRNPSNEAMPE
jgi:primosomal protein N'